MGRRPRRRAPRNARPSSPIWRWISIGSPSGVAAGFGSVSSPSPTASSRRASRRSRSSTIASARPCARGASIRRSPPAIPAPADWRVHFHAPLHWEPQERGLRTTATDLLALIARVAATRPLPHLEVETYTWNVLPESLRPRDDQTLVEGIAREIEFAERALAACGADREPRSRSSAP